MFIYYIRSVKKKKKKTNQSGTYKKKKKNPNRGGSYIDSPNWIA